jgi:hypothetical protein
MRPDLAQWTGNVINVGSILLRLHNDGVQPSANIGSGRGNRLATFIQASYSNNGTFLFLGGN